jgi:hypothetical protein
MLIENEQGNYHFVPSSTRYSAAVTASPGYELVRVILKQPRPLLEGFDLIREHLLARKRPETALCALELRSPRPYTFAQFAEFNESYHALLNTRGILPGSQNPIARTNVAPDSGSVSEPVVYAFAYSVPVTRIVPFRSFIISGGAEIGEPNLSPSGIVRAGETSEEALLEKAAFVVRAMQNRLEALGALLSEVTAVNIYTIHTIHSAMRASLLSSLGAASDHGITWHNARPPISGLEFEMDLRGLCTELCV